MEEEDDNGLRIATFNTQGNGSHVIQTFEDESVHIIAVNEIYNGSLSLVAEELGINY